MDNTKEYFMREALKEAVKAYKKNEVPVGAIIVKDGIIVARAHNTREKSKTAIDHAEVNVINKACKKLGTWRLDGMELYVTLEPCLMCSGAILQSRIKSVYYGANDAKAGAITSVVNSLDFNFCHKVYYEGNILEDDCKYIIQEFFKEIRKNKKNKNGAPETNRTYDQ